MDSLHDALLKRMGKFGLEKAITATMILEAAQRILPPACHAKTFKNGTLTVEVATSAQAYFFKQDQDAYLEMINAALREPVVKKIRLWVNHTA